MDPSFVAILASAICAETQKAIGIAFRLCDPAALPERSQTTLWVPKSMLRRDDSTWHVPRWIILTKIQQARRAYVRRYPDIRLTRHPITADETHLAAVPL